MPTITPCLWFDTEAEQAAELYTSIFPNSRITEISRYNDAGPREPGTVMVVAFELDGQKMVALNGGPEFRFNEAISLQIPCASQEEVDHYWERLTDGGEEGPCGWLKDRFGVSWQVFPTRLVELMGSSDLDVSQRATAAMMKMRKIELPVIEAPPPALPRSARRDAAGLEQVPVNRREKLRSPEFLAPVNIAENALDFEVFEGRDSALRRAPLPATSFREDICSTQGGTGAGVRWSSSRRS